MLKPCKWQKGWATIILLGLAYAIIEEGLAAKSFFDPGWMDIGLLGVYGRWLGVNWLWTTCLLIFHAVYSIALPILILQLLFPSLKNKRLLGKKGLAACFIILFLITFFLNVFVTEYSPGAGLIILSIIIIIALFFLSKRVKPNQFYPKNNQPLIRPRWFGIIGAIFGFLFYMIMYGSPHLIPNALFPVTLEILLFSAVLFFIIKYSGIANNLSHKLAFISGILSFLIILAVVHEFRGLLGMSLVAVFFIGFLFYLRKRIHAVNESTNTQTTKENN